MEQFPVGGPRQPVYNFLQRNGFIMSRNNDKCWMRADGVELHLYGTGSMARIFNKEGKVLADEALADAVAKVKPSFART